MAELGSGNGSGYPGGIDTDTSQETTSTVARAACINDANAAIIAIEAELGTNPSGTKDDVKTYLLTEHDTDGTHGNITTGTITTSGAITATTLTLSGASPTAAAANTCYKDNIIKAWVNFNGQGAVAMRDKFNVTGITDNGTGDYTVTWETDFADTSYAVLFGCGDNVISDGVASLNLTSAKAVGSIRIYTFAASTGALTDLQQISVLAIGAQ